MMASAPSVPVIVANLQKNIDAISRLETARKSVCILFHMVNVISNRVAKVGKFVRINYI